jgi:hypothetical protein
MSPSRKATPDLFEEGFTDPVAAATGRGRPPGASESGRRVSRRGPAAASETKRKAGFYLSAEIIDRFNTKFYELKLAGATVDNKSALLEAALAYALDDLDRGAASKVLQRIGP